MKPILNLDDFQNSNKKYLPASLLMAELCANSKEWLQSLKIMFKEKYLSFSTVDRPA